MEKRPLKEDSNPHKLLDLIPRERKWPIKTEDGEGGDGGSTSHHGSSADKSLELRLGLPGDDDEDECKLKKKQGYNGNYNNNNYQPLSMGYFSSVTHSNSSTNINPPWGHARDSSQPCSSRMVDFPTDTKKRAAPAPVVGWPPIRSSRRNLANSSSARLVPDPPRSASAVLPEKASEKPAESCSHKGLFVKINMEGVPIGRKVDLRAYDNYGKLCYAVDILFRHLLAAQMNSSSRGVRSQQDGEKPITGLLDGSGEYTLVYEDNEGDRMLVGDVPWTMFVSTVKRLRVLKTSKLPSLSKVAGGKGKLLKGE